MAPQVVMPPWAKKRAWKRRAMPPMRAETAGPMITDAMGVPQGWEQVPLMGTGMGNREKMKMRAPMRAICGPRDRSLLSSLDMT